MCSSSAVWAVGIANVGHAWGFYTLLTELPSYMDNILHFDMKQVYRCFYPQTVLMGVFWVTRYVSYGNRLLTALRNHKSIKKTWMNWRLLGLSCNCLSEKDYFRFFKTLFWGCWVFLVFFQILFWGSLIIRDTVFISLFIWMLTE